MKFILIDNSITDTNGHHYQYAIFTLKTAQSLGLEPILATNRSFKNTEETLFETIPIYHYGFWAEKKKSSHLSKIINFSKTKQIEKKIKRKYSKYGFFKEIGSTLGEFLSRKIDVGDDSIKISKTALFFILLFIRISIKLSDLLKKKSVKPTIFNEFKNFLDFLEIQSRDLITGTKFHGKRKISFANDTKRLFNKIKLEEDDHVFIPTAGLTEMLGILDFIKKNPITSKINWHLLFRRNIYNGARTNYFTQREATRYVRNAFQIIVAESNSSKMFFYTDSKELTSQYELLGIIKAKTLPIPHTHKHILHHFDNNKIRISYLGDARTEKGYQFLPEIIRDFWVDYIQANKVQFLIQSNFNNPEGEIAPRIARSQLIPLQSDNIKLFFEPLPLEDYNKLLLNSDIVLLLYDSQNYFARSSGILCEALSAGIPVLVPQETWMHREFLKEVYQYHLSLRNKLKIISTVNSESLKWHEADKTERLIFSDNILIFSEHKRRLQSIIQIPKEATHLLVSFNFFNDMMSSLVGCDITQYDSNIKLNFIENVIEKIDDYENGTLFFKIEQSANKIMIELKNPENDVEVRIKNFRIDFLQNENSLQTIPLSVIGHSFRNSNTITDCLKELVDNYKHYLKTARDFSNKYYQYHNANTLVKTLLETSKAKTQ